MDAHATIPIGLPGCRGEIVARHSNPELQQWLAGLGGRIIAGEGEVLFRVRNRVIRFTPPGMPPWPGLCVKWFAKPSWVKGLHYARRGGKAAMSFANALHLARHGVGTPGPLCFFERCEGGRLVEGCLITACVPDATDFRSEMERLFTEDPDCTTFLDLLRLVAGEAGRMHDCGFLHNDLGGQNILLRRTGPRSWADIGFIDLNRGRVVPAGLTLEQRGRDLARLRIPSHLRRIFHHMYFNDAPVPEAFARAEAAARRRVELHFATSRFRHPIRHMRRARRIITYSRQRSGRDMWLWDARSGQPSVMLDHADRRRFRRASDRLFFLWHNLRKAAGLWSWYRRLSGESYARPVAMAGRMGVSIEPSAPDIAEQMRRVAELPGISVFVRCHYHQGGEGIRRVAEAVAALAADGHEVALGLLQSREAVLEPERWREFCLRAMDAVGGSVRFAEVGHAVNRVKWGVWSLAEAEALWRPVEELRRRHPQVKFLGPAVNDFEYHWFAPLLARMGGLVDGLSCHLYVDRRGAPENRQGRHSTLEKCALGRAVAAAHGLGGFYVTEVNWPLKGTAEHSPVMCPYVPPGRPEHPLHVDEAAYAAYMVRYFLIAVCSGHCERVWWWRLAARGYGILDDGALADGGSGRPAWRALVFLHRLLGAAEFRRHEQEGPVHVFHFDRAVVAYATEPADWTVPQGFTRACDIEGRELPAPGGILRLGGAPVYLPASGA